ncbi:signaling lymphocytic activation molecule-like isoform X2 [Heptranchias perlo]|uniref:signaling lymphocytic activation molecule-like isoform X2 n=1 Tax=Heptranchias perlo TaxID=212740 RepID=UPI0035597B8B
MFSWGSDIPTRIVIRWLFLAFLNDPGGIGQAVGNLVPRHLVNGTLGQSIILPTNIRGAELVITWDFTNSTTGKKIEVCSKPRNSPAECNNELGERFRLNLSDYSLQIQTLLKSDNGLYEVTGRSGKGVNEEAVELRVYERVSSPSIRTSDVLSDGSCNVTLICSVESSSELIYSWWRGGGEVIADGSHSVNDSGSRLAVSLNPYATSTVYNCTVRNPVSEESRSVDLAGPCNITMRGDEQQGSKHVGLFTGITLVVVALIVIVIIYMRKKKQSKPDEAPYTEGTSEPVQYAEISRPSSARDQSQGHLRQLDASQGQQRRGVQLTTIYDEIKFNPDVSAPMTAMKKGQKSSANA